ncbi:amidohydrolase [Virgibacillus sp. NKC19-3]|nr:amidohydrolase [Virgibacillus sp. NKC19-3]
MKIKAKEMRMQLVEWRRKFHANPELSFQEMKTSQMVARILENMPGMHVQRNAGYPTAVVGTLSSGKGPTFAIRADMDALPIQEANIHEYRSQNSGVMHACGHDAHMSIGLGVAHLLSKAFKHGEMQGTVKFLFQPAEERADEHGSTGAPYMIQTGVLDDVDAVIALHMSPEHQLGEVLVHDGYSMANVDVFDAKILGTGGHAAYPHQGSDPVWMLSPVLAAVYGITARRISPLESAVISIGAIHSGSANNILPSEVAISGTIRSYGPDVRKRLHKELEKAFSMVKVWQGDYALKISPEDPALENDPRINRFIKRTIRGLYPDFHIRDMPFGLGGEDFAHMTRRISGAMFFLGCAVNDGVSRNLHTPTFDIDERSLPVGVSIIAETARRYLMKEEGGEV